MIKEKIKNSIIIVVFLLISSILALFFNFLNPILIKSFTNLNIISKNNSLLVHFVNVGQGDAIAINLPDGKVMCIDCGPNRSVVGLEEYLKSKVVNDKRNKKIDYLVLTHSDADHVGGLERLVEDFYIDTIFLPTSFEETQTYMRILNKLDEYNTEILYNTNGYEINNAGYEIQFLVSSEYNNENDLSAVVKLEYQNRRFLFAADIEAKAEHYFVNNAFDLDADVLKVAHHGSKYSSSKEFLDKVNCKYAIISSADTEKLPSGEALSRLEMAGANILTTYEQGTMCFAVGDNYDLSLFVGSYTTTNHKLDYRIVLIVVDFVAVAIYAVSIVKTKKEKRKARISREDLDKELEIFEEII